MAATRPCKRAIALRIYKEAVYLHLCKVSLQISALRCERARRIHGA